MGSWLSRCTWNSNSLHNAPHTVYWTQFCVSCFFHQPWSRIKSSELKPSIKTKRMHIFSVICSSESECIFHTEKQKHKNSNFSYATKTIYKQQAMHERAVNFSQNPNELSTDIQTHVSQQKKHSASQTALFSRFTDFVVWCPLLGFEHFEKVAFDTSIWLRVFAKHNGHRLKNCIHLYKKQRTLHVPVVWPSAPCTQDITALTAQAKPTRILCTECADSYIIILFFFCGELYVSVNCTTFVCTRPETRKSTEKKKNLNKCHAPKT